MPHRSNRTRILVAAILVSLGCFIMLWRGFSPPPSLPQPLPLSATPMLTQFSLATQAQYSRPSMAVQTFLLPLTSSLMIRYEDGSIEVRSMASFQIEAIHPARGTSTLSHDGRLVASERLTDQTNEGSRITIWSVTDPSYSKILLSSEPITEDLAWYPDNAHIVVLSQKDIILLRVVDNAIIWRQQADTDAVRSIDMSPDGTLFVTSGQTNQICLWRVADGKIMYCLANQGPLTAFSPDGTILAVLDRTRTIRLWQSRTGAYIGALQHVNDAMNQILFDPSGAFIIGSTSGGQVLCWRLTDLRLLSRTTITTATETIRTLLLSQEPAVLFAGATSSISLWRVKRSYEHSTR